MNRGTERPKYNQLTGPAAWYQHRAVGSACLVVKVLGDTVERVLSSERNTQTMSKTNTVGAVNKEYRAMEGR